MEKHVVDRKNLALKVETLKTGLEILGLWEDGGFHSDVAMLKGNGNVNEFIAWAKKYASEIKRTINLKVNGARSDDSPMEVVKSFLKVAGLKVVKVSKERLDNKSNYVDVYQLDSRHLGWVREQSKKRERI